MISLAISRKGIDTMLESIISTTIGSLLGAAIALVILFNIAN